MPKNRISFSYTFGWYYKMDENTGKWKWLKKKPIESNDFVIPWEYHTFPSTQSHCKQKQPVKKRQGPHENKKMQERQAHSLTLIGLTLLHADMYKSCNLHW